MQQKEKHGVSERCSRISDMIWPSEVHNTYGASQDKSAVNQGIIMCLHIQAYMYAGKFHGTAVAVSSNI